MKGFVKISKYAGMREDLVQAGGGNSSCKISNTEMIIKASGYQLADVTETDGYAVVNPQVIRSAFLNAEDIENFTEEDGKTILETAFIEGKKPSIETFLHAISGKYTLHTHPIVVNALTCRVGGMGELVKLFPDALIVPYATPGIELAKAFFKEYKKASNDGIKDYELIFLQNHGLVVSADSAEKVIEKIENVVKTIEQYLKVDMQAYRNVTEIWKYFKSSIVWRVTDINVVNHFELNQKMWKHAFCPDCVVFLGKKAIMLDKSSCLTDLEEFRKKNADPVLVIYCGRLYIVAESVKKALEIQSVLSFSAQVMLLNRGHECNLLSDDEQNFLLDWDAEKYRKNLK